MSTNESASTISIHEKAHRHLSEMCPKCGLRMLCQNQNKYWCDNCRGVDDYFQDGDKVEPG